jgi:hypothetical protein
MEYLNNDDRKEMLSWMLLEILENKNLIKDFRVDKNYCIFNFKDVHVKFLLILDTSDEIIKIKFYLDNKKIRINKRKDEKITSRTKELKEYITKTYKEYYLYI